MSQLAKKEALGLCAVLISELPIMADGKARLSSSDFSVCSMNNTLASSGHTTIDY